MTDSKIQKLKKEKVALESKINDLYSALAYITNKEGGVIEISIDDIINMPDGKFSVKKDNRLIEFTFKQV